jgi:signal transduction histidine kinase
VHGNASRLGRAVYNLTDNAVRHAGDEKWIGIALKTEKGRVIIEVSDHGNGIAKDELERIWDRYYTSRQRNGKGVSGLGLAIVKHIAEVLHATIQLNSAVGFGTEIRIGFKV